MPCLKSYGFVGEVILVVDRDLKELREDYHNTQKSQAQLMVVLGGAWVDVWVEDENGVRWYFPIMWLVMWVVGRALRSYERLGEVL